MHMTVLVAFLIVFLSEEAGTGSVPLPILLPAAGGYILVSVLLGWLGSTLSSLRKKLEDLAHWRSLSRWFFQGWLLGGHACLVFIFGLREIIKNSVPGMVQVPVACDMLAMLPFFFSILGNWIMGYRIYLHTRKMLNLKLESRKLPSTPVWTLREFLVFNARHDVLFVVVPMFLIKGLMDAVEMSFVATFPEGTTRDTAIIISLVALAAMFLITSPLAIVKIWSTSPMPDGDLRDSLEDICSKKNISFRNMLVWKSKGTLANAAVIGIIPGARYILISDAVLERLSTREILAVFAHELGHIINRHIFYMTLFVLSSMTLCYIAGWLVSAALLETTTINMDTSIGFFVLLAALAWFFGLGPVSRQFEHQCDAYSAWMMGQESDNKNGEDKITPEGAKVFAKALKKLVELGGEGLRRKNLRHGRAIHRICKVQHLASIGASMEDVNRRVRRTKILLLVITAIMAVCASMAGFLIR